jgi:hypothetical protein
MDLKKIMSISGYPGIFQLVSQGKNSVIVESLLDKKRMPAFSSHKISTLEDIAVFTETRDVPLKEVLKNIYDKESGKECIDTKSDTEKLKAYFGEILPDYDKNRVYVSDIKKILSWYNILQKNNLLDFTEKPEETEENKENVTSEEEGASEKKAKAPVKKKAPAKPKATNMAAKGNVKAKGKGTSFSSKKGGE